MDTPEITNGKVINGSQPRENGPGEPLTETEMRSAVDIANVPALLMVVYQVTGDERWLEAPYLPTRGKGLGDHDHGGLPEDIQREIRDAAVDAMLGLQAGEAPAIETLSPDLITRMMSACMGEAVGPEYGEMLSTEFARRSAPEAAQAQLVRREPPAGFNAIVIGAGVGGITAAHQFEDMGVDYTILEKQPEPGGNWWQNTYPGAGVDTPSHLYSLFFAKNDWAKHFELRDELQKYLARVIQDIGATAKTRFGTEALTATYDADSGRWAVDIRNPDGSIEILYANVLISAVGVLNRPKLPALPGMDLFEGTAFHSAHWPEDLELTGKRVALVGTGASSMQIVPEIAKDAANLTIFQRSPAWVAPFEKFGTTIPPDLRRLLRSCPLYHAWYWLRLFWQFGDRVIEALRIDPEWPHPERAVNARNDGHREFFERYMTQELEGRDDLRAKVQPTYPPYGKRILLDNGWYSTLRRDNVTLVDEAVVEVREHSLVTASREEHEFDVIVWATGFQATRFVSSLDIRGIDGVSLRDAWDDDNPRAYLGVSVPGFPNLFLLGGPNSFPGSGSFMFFMEVQMRYIRSLLTEMFERGVKAIDARADANDAYNALVDARHQHTVWTHPGMSTYYRNSRGRVVFVMPFLNVEYWEMTKQADLEHYTTR